MGTVEDPEVDNLICKFCNKYYELPVLITCGKTCCREHLQDLLDKSPLKSEAEVRNFFCVYCNKDHPIMFTAEYEFLINKSVSQKVQLHLKSRPQIQRAKMLMEDIKKISTNFV